VLQCTVGHKIIFLLYGILIDSISTYFFSKMGSFYAKNLSFTVCFSQRAGNYPIDSGLKMRNGILLPKLFCPTVRKTFEILGFSFFSEF
jgi:hypothetical protein